MAVSETSDTTDAGARKPSMIATLAIVAALSLVAAGGGWLLGGTLAPEQDATTAAEVDPDAAGGQPDSGHGEAAATQHLVNLEPITTNLAYPRENWVRLEVSVLFEQAADPEMAQAIHQDILAYLRTVSLQQIEGPRGFQYLRDDLVERASLRSDGAVSNLLFRTFVIE